MVNAKGDHNEIYVEPSQPHKHRHEAPQFHRSIGCSTRHGHDRSNKGLLSHTQTTLHSKTRVRLALPTPSMSRRSDRLGSPKNQNQSKIRRCNLNRHPNRGKNFFGATLLLLLENRTLSPFYSPTYVEI